ncbi:NAD(P)/FAD-dependent oxidoreductase [Arcticibacterium luteifluviistationis]|uniref:FAD-dependent oxidoreductase n=1 Tax=Arcticibacterium luteifluviistationis TaxID=1784714 RepID=A0A2Z4GAI4_9BACT|nr:FAD-dependent oxidoreductase [Arcticibacterium luteifluviistationis]AWV98154.1 FAD-dependent oxidoreductase [Arcticibacterium luteifluviistationis]
METDYLIIGQGLAGTCLAHQFIERGKTVKIIQNQDLPSSSKVAGGMFNPVTGKRLARTWKQQETFSYLNTFYQGLETILNTKVLHKIQLFRPYKNENQRSQFIKAIASKGLDDLLLDIPGNENKNDSINAPLGGILTSESGRLDVPLFLKKSAEYFTEKGLLELGNFELKHLVTNEDVTEYKSVKYSKIIFCEGFHVKDNPLFNWLPFNPVKGETLDVTLPESINLQEIINQGAWLMPMGENKYKMGSTYDWDNLDFKTTEKAKEEILEKSRNFLKAKPTIIAQSAGVRPAVDDRRPILGKHPKQPNIVIFNGLGTKGVSLAPYLSRQLAEHLIEGKEIDSESTIERFYTLYS